VTFNFWHTGCGSGHWFVDLSIKNKEANITNFRAADMGHKFPHAEIVGVDASPVSLDSDEVPQNVRFEVDDVNNDLSHFHGSFDLVHMRMVQMGILDMSTLIRRLQRCLVPGGMLIIIDITHELWDSTHQLVNVARLDDDEDTSNAQVSGSWLARLLLGMLLP